MVGQMHTFTEGSTFHSIHTPNYSIFVPVDCIAMNADNCRLLWIILNLTENTPQWLFVLWTISKDVGLPMRDISAQKFNIDFVAFVG